MRFLYEAIALYQSQPYFEADFKIFICPFMKNITENAVYTFFHENLNLLQY